MAQEFKIISNNTTTTGGVTFTNIDYIDTSGTTISFSGMSAMTFSGNGDNINGFNTNLMLNDSSTGVIAFTGLSFTASATTFNTGAIDAWFVDNTTNPSSPSRQFVHLSAQTNIALTNLTGQSVTYIAISSAGTITQQASPFLPTQQRSLIHLGVIVHTNRTFINAVNNQPAVSISPSNQLSDLMTSIGIFNVYGNVFTPNGVNLNINKSSGEIFKQGINFLNDNKDPHTLVLSALIAPSNIRYRLQTGTEFADTALIDPGFYDVGGVRTAVGNNNFSIQRIYMFQTNLVRIQYGQAQYATLSDAIQGISTEAFVVEQNILENGLFRGLLLVKNNVTNLSDTTKALFIEVGKFGSVAGLGSLSTTSLQQAYNNSLNPEILTSVGLGGVTIQNGSGADNSSFLLEGVNSGGTTTSFIRADGAISATTYLGLPLDIRVTGGTPNNSAKTYTFTNNTGGTFTVNGLTDISITGFTYNNANTFTLINSTGGTFSVINNTMTGLTVNGSLSAITVSATSIISNTQLLIESGVIAPTTPTGALVYVVSDTSSTFKNSIFDAYGNANAAAYILRRARGTSTSPTAVVSGDSLGVFGFRGYATTAFTSSVAFIRGVAVDTFTTTANGAKLSFFTTPSGTTTTPEVMTLSSQGNLLIGNTADTSTGKLQVSGNANITGLTTTNTIKITSAPTAGYVLTSDSNGNGTWQISTASGSSVNPYITGFTYDNANQFTLTNNTGGTLSVIANTMTGLTIVGTGLLSTGNINGEIIVRTLSDFPTPVSNVINLAANVTYRIKGSINLGANYISASTSNTIYGVDKSNDTIIYTGSGGAIRVNNNDLTVKYITLVASVGQVFDLTLSSTNNLQISDCIFGSSISIGSIKNGNVVIIERSLFSTNSAGLTVSASTYFTYSDNIHIGNTGTSLTINAGAASSTSIIISRCNFNILTGQTALNISTGVTVSNGVIANTFFEGVGTILTGINRLSPNWIIESVFTPVTTNFNTLQRYMSRANAGSWIRFRASNGTVTPTGAGGTNLSAPTATPANDNNTTYTAYPSAASIGSIAGLQTTSLAEFRVNHNPVFEAVISTGSLVTAVRYWIGVGSSALTNVDDLAGSSVMFRFSTVAGDTGWRPIVDNGTTQTIGTAIGTVAASTQYKFRISVDFANGKTYFSVNNSDWTVVNATPNSGTDLGILCGVIATTASARTINFSRFDVIHD